MGVRSEIFGQIVGWRVVTGDDVSDWIESCSDKQNTIGRQNQDRAISNYKNEKFMKTVNKIEMRTMDARNYKEAVQVY
mgnify:CR=1 FL=1